MGWQQEQFKRRIGELAAEFDGIERAYIPPPELENDIAYSWDYIWNCLAKAWAASRAMERSPLTFHDEVEQWLAESGARRPRVISQAFVETILGHRAWNNKCEMSRFEMVDTIHNVSEPETRQGHDDLGSWHSEIVTECADIHKTRSLPDANYTIGRWAEKGSTLSRLWSLYERGPMATEDRTALRALVVEITNASDLRVEAWISAKERLNK